MNNPLKFEPVRLHAIATAALALVAFYVPTLPTALILGLVAAVIGVGEGVRSQVTPTAKVITSIDDVATTRDFWEFGVVDGPDTDA